MQWNAIRVQVFFYHVDVEKCCFVYQNPLEIVLSPPHYIIWPLQLCAIAMEEIWIYERNRTIKAMRSLKSPKINDWFVFRKLVKWIKFFLTIMLFSMQSCFLWNEKTEKMSILTLSWKNSHFKAFFSSFLFQSRNAISVLKGLQLFFFTFFILAESRTNTLVKS